jgi:glycine betaine/proline transport system ATP-binding protein
VENGKVILRVERLVKLYGLNKQSARELLKKGADKKEVLRQTGVTVAVDNVSFDVKKGEIFVLIGLSGSGKSTVIRCVNMLQQPTSGKIMFEEQDIGSLSRSELIEFRRTKASMVFQNFGLMSHRDVLSNVAYGLEVRGIKKEEREKKAMEMISMVGLDGWEHKSISSLSGGMRQRVGIARALTNDPDMLLMDEPFSALDPLVRRDMQFELLSIQRKMNKTILFITHDIDEAFKLGDRIAIMRDGRIIQNGTAGEMASSPADDYVRDFIDSADKSRVLCAKNIMITPTSLIRVRDGAGNALSAMKKGGVSSAYVIDEKMVFLGVLTLEDAMKAKTENLPIDSFILRDVDRVFQETIIADIMPLAAQTRFPIAVIDEESRLKGIVSKAAVLSSLS